MSNHRVSFSKSSNKPGSDMYVSFGAGGATHPLSCFCGGVGSGGLCGYLYSLLEQISCSLHNSVWMNKKALYLFSTSIRSTCGFQCKSILQVYTKRIALAKQLKLSITYSNIVSNYFLWGSLRPRLILSGTYRSFFKWLCCNSC